MRKPRKSEPRVSVLCRCGAQWHGRWALDNPVIAQHARRCGPPVDVATFRQAGGRLKIPDAWKNDVRWALRGAVTDALLKPGKIRL